MTVEVVKPSLITNDANELKNTVNLLIERLEDEESVNIEFDLNSLKNLIKSSNSNMGDVPPILKYLHHYWIRLISLQERYMKKSNDDSLMNTCSRLLADMLSYISITYEKSTNNFAILKYRMIAEGSFDFWGYEYMRHLSHSIMMEFNSPDRKVEKTYLDILINHLVEYFLNHNSEIDACDLLYECECLGKLSNYFFKGHDLNSDYKKICTYLESCIPFESYSEDREMILEVILNILLRMEDYTSAMIIALKMNNEKGISDIFNRADIETAIRYQLAFMLSRHRKSIDYCNIESLNRILRNEYLPLYFDKLLKELNVMEPKTLDDIYRSDSYESALRLPTNSKNNLANFFVNGLVNAGSKSDKFLLSEDVLQDEPSRSPIFRMKDHSLVSAVASLGLLFLWNSDLGLFHLEKFFSGNYSNNILMKSGAVLAIGIIYCGIKSEGDQSLALVRDVLENNQDSIVKTTSMISLSLIFAGSRRIDILNYILPFIGDINLNTAVNAALSLAHIFVGSGDGEIASAILQTLMERDGSQLDCSIAKLFGLALGLLYVGRRLDEIQPIVETLDAIPHKIAQEIRILLHACAFASSGDILKIQEFLRLCTENSENGKDQNIPSYAVIGIAMISLLEDLSKEMSLRLFNQMMQSGCKGVRKAVPLALALLYASNPINSVIDCLTKFSHDNSKEVALNSIFALGLVAAGTNNSKVAQTLRQLSLFYQRDSECLFAVKIAQGLVYMGKGTMTLNPVYANRRLVNHVSLASLLTFLLLLLDSNDVIDQYSYLFYYLINALYPKFLWTLSEDLEPINLSVRVGQAIDIVGQAGKPKAITGFQTHNTPVLINFMEKVEIAEEHYYGLSEILENFVIVKNK